MAAPECLTRDAKKPDARKAVIAVLKRYPLSEFMSSRDFDEVLDRMVALIQECRLVDFLIDERDVHLALRYLHNQGVLKVTHGKEEADYVHRVYLTR